MTELRIVSLLPAATEMAFALGLGEAVVGVSHECDHPPEARGKPVVVRPALDLARMRLSEIDAAVAERIGRGGALYLVNEPLLRELAPTLILTQDLCQVCAPSGSELAQVLRRLSPAPHVLSMTPHSLDDVLATLTLLGQAAGCAPRAQVLVETLRGRLRRLRERTGSLSLRPRVFCMEWADPVYCAGHWVPQMVELAGGEDALARRGCDSVRIRWEQVLQWAPEVLVLAPCGFDLAGALPQISALERLAGWWTLPAVRSGRVYCVHANAYFARPGPRLIEGTELLAHLLHPQLPWTGPADAYQRVSRSSPPSSVTTQRAGS